MDINKHLLKVENIIETLIIYKHEIQKVNTNKDQMIFLERNLDNIEDLLLEILYNNKTKNIKIQKKMNSYIDTQKQIKKMLPLLLQIFMEVNE